MFSQIKIKSASNTDTPTNFLAAVKANNISLVKACIKQNPSLIHATDPDGRTALFITSRSGHLQMVDFLLANGANVNQAEANDGATPLFLAAQNGHTDIVELLLDYGAHVNQARTADGATALITAAQKGYYDIVELLLNLNANLNQATTDNGTTALMLAAYNGHKDIAELLLNHDANLNQARTNDDATSLLVAAQNGHKDIVELLLNRGAHVNQEKIDGGTPLFVAAQNGHKDIVKLLLDHNADIHLTWTNHSGQKITAYKQAMHYGHVVIAAMIRNKMAPSFSDRLEAIEYDESIPDKYLDPISCEIMNDPIAVSSGITYDRDSLAGWFKQNGYPETLPCPITKLSIHRHELENRANVIIKNDIEAFVTEKEKESKADKAIPSMRALSASGTLHFSSSSPVPAADGIENCPRLHS